MCSMSLSIVRFERLSLSQNGSNGYHYPMRNQNGFTMDRHAILSFRSLTLCLPLLLSLSAAFLADNLPGHGPSVRHVWCVVSVGASALARSSSYCFASQKIKKYVGNS